MNSIEKRISFIIAFCVKNHHTAQNLFTINLVQCGGTPTMAYQGLKKKKRKTQEIWYNETWSSSVVFAQMVEKKEEKEKTTKNRGKRKMSPDINSVNVLCIKTVLHWCRQLDSWENKRWTVFIDQVTILRPDPLIDGINKVGRFFREYGEFPLRAFILCELAVFVCYTGIVHWDDRVFTPVSIDNEVEITGIIN